MKSKFILCLMILLSTLVVAPWSGLAHADTFNQNHIIDDGIFDRTDSMNASQIDSFLNSFPNSCISPNSGFKSIDPTGYNPTGGYQYGGFVTGGQVIYDAAQAYDLNPQVLLTTLQKEQSLVVGGAGYCSNGDQNKYAAAVGYGCPDSGTTYSYSGLSLYQRNGTTVTNTGTTCVNSPTMAGFSQQVIRAAWLLKFGEQRSKGNINWAIIRGNWNNSDDPQTCYGGPMTQGTWQRCPSGATTFYDGYTSIDGVSVHMDTGGTAALYWYTPHFSGNQHFFDIFTGWFGSTSFPQPLGGALLYQASTGKIFLVTDGVRYYIPTWDIMTNYKLDRYALQPSTDVTIQQYSDGGTLTNLIWNSDGVFLVNNGMKHHVSGEMCTAWGLSCFDNSVVKPLGAAFQSQYLQSGGDLTQIAVANDVAYRLSGGLRQPVANYQSLTGLGLQSVPQLVANSSNLTQPLGTLLITTPGVISFASNAMPYYFDGASYYSLPSTSIAGDWGINVNAKLGVPSSSYDLTPPASVTLSSWYQDGAGNKFIVDQGRKVLIPSSLSSSWQTVTFNTSLPSMFGKLPQVTLQPDVYSNGVYTLSGGKKHHIPTWQSYLALGVSDAITTQLSDDKLTPVPLGNDALGDGTLITLDGDNQGIYVMNNSKITHIPDYPTLVAYGFNLATVLHYPTSIESDYPLDSTPLGNTVLSGDYFTVSPSGLLYKISSTQSSSFGVIPSRFKSTASPVVQNARIVGLSKFMYNVDTGKIYYDSGGAIHYVATYSAYVAYGGLRTPTSILNNAGLASFTEAQAVY